MTKADNLPISEKEGMDYFKNLIAHSSNVLSAFYDYWPGMIDIATQTGAYKLKSYEVDDNYNFIGVVDDAFTKAESDENKNDGQVLTDESSESESFIKVYLNTDTGEVTMDEPMVKNAESKILCHHVIMKKSSARKGLVYGVVFKPGSSAIS